MVERLAPRQDHDRLEERVRTREVCSWLQISPITLRAWIREWRLTRRMRYPF
jgi:hypothetical protein